MLKLNVGFSRKVGEPDFGSRGASVNVEIELDVGVIREPDRFRGQIQHLFTVAKTSVDEQLNGGTGTGMANSQPQSHVANGHSQNGHRNGNGNNGHSNNGHGSGNRTNRLATQSQVRAIHAIANRQRVDLPGLLQNRFQVNRPDDLSLRDASHVIDELKSQPASNG